MGGAADTGAGDPSTEEGTPGETLTGAGDPSTEEGTPGEKLTGAEMGTPDSPEGLPALIEF